MKSLNAPPTKAQEQNHSGGDCESANRGENPVVLADLVHGVCFPESCSLELECKVGGSFHTKANTPLRLTVKKYREGSMKRTLERDLKEPALAGQQAYRMIV
mmetsp:Transcript_23204/g.33723  ORF Transcript_23204/g.33723 Transcript_23204/m.33723 type:complete len:102 (-) Transcript_23204:213-518(-)